MKLHPSILFFVSLVASKVGAQTDFNFPTYYVPPTDVGTTIVSETTTTACVLPYCEFGYNNCFNCTDCRCNYPPTETTVTETESTSVTSCEQPSDPFCSATLIDGKCETACCSLPYCEGGIDWSYCVSCAQCRCLPPSTVIVTEPTPESTPCDIQCENLVGCSVYANQWACRCEYDCSTTGPTRKPRSKKLKCGPAK